MKNYRLRCSLINSITVCALFLGLNFTSFYYRFLSTTFSLEMNNSLSPHLSFHFSHAFDLSHGWKTLVDDRKRNGGDEERDENKWNRKLMTKHEG